MRLNRGERPVFAFDVGGVERLVVSFLKTQAHEAHLPYLLHFLAEPMSQRWVAISSVQEHEMCHSRPHVWALRAFHGFSKVAHSSLHRMACSRRESTIETGGA